MSRLTAGSPKGRALVHALAFFRGDRGIPTAKPFTQWVREHSSQSQSRSGPTFGRRQRFAVLPQRWFPESTAFGQSLHDCGHRCRLVRDYRRTEASSRIEVQLVMIRLQLRRLASLVLENAFSDAL